MKLREYNTRLVIDELPSRDPVGKERIIVARVLVTISKTNTGFRYYVEMDESKSFTVIRSTNDMSVQDLLGVVNTLPLAFAVIFTDLTGEQDD